MSERKCVNCRHRILKDSSSFCGVSGNFLHYGTVFEHWCRHWAKRKDGLEAKFIVIDELHTMEQTAKKGREGAWLRNLTSLKMGEFGIDTKSPKTLLKYWEAQELAGYPNASENVKYFEEMLRKENDNT